jgi:uncharacterized membrane protein YqhA
MRKAKDEHRESDSRKIGKAERAFEAGLWGTRYVVMLPIAFSLVGAAIMFVLGSADIARAAAEAARYLANGDAPADLRSRIIAEIIGAIDIYLIAIVLLIFSFGIYKLFVSRLEIAERSEASKILDVHSLDGLKDKLTQVIIIALIVKFFQMVITMADAYGTATDLLLLSSSILGLGACLFFLYLAKARGGSSQADEP